MNICLSLLFHTWSLLQSVTTDHHCIDSYMQLSYCNLCGARTELPCLANCVDVLESCLVNITLIDNGWRTFLGKLERTFHLLSENGFGLDALENNAYFDNIDKVLSSIGLSISDAVMAFFNSGGVQKKDVRLDRSICIILRIIRYIASSRSSINVDIYVFDVKRSLSIKNPMTNTVEAYHYLY